MSIPYAPMTIIEYPTVPVYIAHLDELPQNLPEGDTSSEGGEENA